MANFCVECGVKVEQDWKFCPICGKALPLVPNKISAPKITTLKKVQNDVKEIKKDVPPRKIDEQVLGERLKEYRFAEATIKSLPAYCIFTNKAIESLLEARNSIYTKEDLHALKHWGAVKTEQYGNDIIEILNCLDQNMI